MASTSSGVLGLPLHALDGPPRVQCGWHAAPQRFRPGYLSPGGGTSKGSFLIKSLTSDPYNTGQPGRRRTSAGGAPLCTVQPTAGQGATTPVPGLPLRRVSQGRHGSLAQRVDPMIATPHVLPGDSEPSRQIPEDLGGELVGPNRLPH